MLSTISKNVTGLTNEQDVARGALSQNVSLLGRSLGIKLRQHLTKLAVALFCCLALPLQAQEIGSAEQPAPMPTKEEAPKPFKKNLFFAATAINLFTISGATETKERQSLDITDRVVLVELLGFGYFPTEHLRLNFSAQFVETVAGPFPGDNRLTLSAVIPWAAYHTGRYYSGAGLLLASRSGGTAEQDWGVFTSHGAAFKLNKKGLSLTTAIVVPFMFGQRVSVAVNPSIGIGYRL